MNFKRYNLMITTAVISFLPQGLLAAPVISPYDGGSLDDFLRVIRSWLLGFAGAAAVLFIVIGGIRYMTAGGDTKKVDSAKATLTYAIIGLVLVLLSQVILSLIAGDLVGSVFGNKGIPYK